MSTMPEVSVVMSVYDAESVLRESVESVLVQQGVELELIVVNDGSRDASGTVLDDYARQDARVRVIHQVNQGLTRALMRGCSEARGTYIARQDAGDMSLPGRLSSEVEVLSANPNVALVSCGTRVIGPAGEHLYDVVLPERDATPDLLASDVNSVRGPHHGSTMFAREAYHRVGGYRKQFYFAQDLDLWTRLAEKGRHLVVPEMFYQALFSPLSISGLQRRRQVEMTRIILECARRRRAGLSQAECLDRASRIVPDCAGPSAFELANALYFIGSCLRKRHDPRARGYFRKAWRTQPLHVKSALRLISGA